MTYAKGKNVSEAAGIGAGGLAALDYYEEVSSIPDAFKEVRVITISGENDILNNDTLLVRQARPMLSSESNQKEISVQIMNKILKYSVKVTPFEFVLTELADFSYRVACDSVKCKAHMEDGFCMWRADKKLINLAHDQTYEMCEKLRTSLLSMKN